MTGRSTTFDNYSACPHDSGPVASALRAAKNFANSSRLASSVAVCCNASVSKGNHVAVAVIAINALSGKTRILIYIYTFLKG